MQSEDRRTAKSHAKGKYEMHRATDSYKSACQKRRQPARRPKYSQCQGRAVTVGCGCGFKVSAAVAVGAAGTVAAAVTVVLNRFGCKLSLLLAREI